MQKFIRQIVLVFRFLYFKFFWGNKSVCNTLWSWLNIPQQKNSVLKILILIVCWPENGRPLLAPPRNDVWLTREDQQRMTNEVSLLRVLLIGWNKFHFWNYEYMKNIYVNCGVKNYLKEDHRSCICNSIMQLRKEGKPAKKKFRLVRDSNPWHLRYWRSALPIKLTSQLGAGRWISSW